MQSILNTEETILCMASSWYVTKKEVTDYDNRKNQWMYQLWYVRNNMPHGCYCQASKNQKSDNQAPRRLSDMSSMQNVLPC